MAIYETSDTFTRHRDLVHLPNQGRPVLPSWVLSPIILPGVRRSQNYNADDFIMKWESFEVADLSLGHTCGNRESTLVPEFLM